MRISDWSSDVCSSDLARRLRRDLPVVGIWDQPPLVDLLADSIDDRGVRVLLLFGGKPFALVEQQRGLIAGSLALLGFGDRRNEFCSPAGSLDLLGRLTGFVELPVLARVVVR